MHFLLKAVLPLTVKSRGFKNKIKEGNPIKNIQKKIFFFQPAGN